MRLHLIAHLRLKCTVSPCPRVRIRRIRSYQVDLDAVVVPSAERPLGRAGELAASRAAAERSAAALGQTPSELFAASGLMFDFMKWSARATPQYRTRRSIECSIHFVLRTRELPA